MDIQVDRRGRAWEFTSGGFHLLVDNVTPKGSGIEAWCEVWWKGDIDPRRLHFGRYDLMGARTVSSLKNAATAATFDHGGEAWRDFFTEAVYQVIDSELKGTPAERLDGDTSTAGPRFLLSPLVGSVGATSLVGAGGSTKSYLALAACVAVSTGRGSVVGGMKVNQTGPALFLDWEADRDTHNERLAALCRGAELSPADVPVFYSHQVYPVRRSVNAVAKQVSDVGAVMVVIDSVMLARGGDAFGPEETLAMYAALRELGVPALLVDHKSKEDLRKKRDGAFGSIVNANSARLMWEFKQTVWDGPELAVRLEATKQNNVGKMRNIGLAVRFDNNADDVLEAVTYRQISPMKVVETSGPTWKQAIPVLDGGALTSAEIGERLGVAANTITNALKRHPDTFFRDGERWHLLPDWGRDADRDAAERDADRDAP